MSREPESIKATTQQWSAATRFAGRSAIVAAALALVMACSSEEAPEAPPEQQTQRDVEPVEAAEPAVEDDARRERTIQRLGQVSVPAQEDWIPDTFDLPDPAADINLALDQANRALDDGRLLQPEGNSARDYFLSVLEREPDNQEARDGLRTLGARLVAAGIDALDEGDVRQAVTFANAVGELDISPPSDLAVLNRRLTRQRSIAAALQAGNNAAADGRLVSPAENSAVYYYQQALEVDPGNADALRGLEVVEEEVLSRAMASSADGDFVAARRWLGIAADIREGDSSGVERTRLAISDAEEDAVDDLVARANRALGDGDVASAVELVEVLEGMRADNNADVQDVIERVRLAEVYGNFEPGQRFSDNATGSLALPPELVVLPSRVFNMGSPDNEIGRSDNEGPQREIRMNRPLAMSRTEISVGQFAEFVQATGYTTDAERRGNSFTYRQNNQFSSVSGVTWRNNYRGDQAASSEPVVHVSWNDANAYVEWLNQQLGGGYRLPSEAEFEYALRGGTETRYWWGYGGPPEVMTNVAGSRDRSPNDNTWDSAFFGYGDGHWGPAPVGSFQENGFGLMDMAGNVSEWVADCYADTLEAIPADGGVHERTDCTQRSVRGGSWASHPQDVRSAARRGENSDYSDARIGFRVVKILEI